MLNKTNVGAIAKVPPSFRDRVTLLVKEASFGNSKNSGKPMITLKCEIISPSTASVDGKEYIIASQEITYYLGLSTELNGKAKSSPWAQTYDFLEKCGLPCEVDPESPNLECFDRFTFDIIGTTRERIATRQEGGKYVPILDGNNKPISQGWEWSNGLGDVLGASDIKADSAV